MSTWYNKVSEDLANIADCIEYFDQELQSARKEVRLIGLLEKQSAELPGITEYRFNQLQEIEAILELLNIKHKKERSDKFRQYLEKYNRQLSSRDAEKYVDGEQSVIGFAELVNEFALLRNKYLGVMKGLDVKQWQIGHITRLRTAGLEDIVID